MGIKLSTGTAQRQLGKTIQVLRRQKELTQEELAEKVGVDRSYMGFIERGERNPTLDKIEKIARALGVSMKKLFE